MIFRRSPGPCIICGAEYTACTHDAGPITVPQLPQRDALLVAAAAAGGVPDVPPPAAAPLQAEAVQRTLPPGHFTTGTYRRNKR